MYEKSNRSLWTGRIDSLTEEAHYRHFQAVQFDDINSEQSYDIAILGYAVDEGVKLNKGRVGAKEGPDAVKAAFSTLPYNGLSLVDYGNVLFDQSLIKTQKLYSNYASTSMKRNKFTWLIGGGHDIAYAHYLALRLNHPDKSIGLINIDAHFDNRLAQESTSGTAFHQILNNDENTDYLALGIQQSGNTKALFDEAKKTGTTYVLADDINHLSDVTNIIDTFINQHDIVMLTLCMDVIDAAYAPAVSAPCVLGLNPKIVTQIMQYIKENAKLESISIAEMNPTYDIDHRTAKLIAHMMYRVTYSN